MNKIRYKTVLVFLLIVFFSCDTGTNTTENNLNPDETGPLPSNLNVNPKTGVYPGDGLFITGTDLDCVSYAIFVGVPDKVFPTSISISELELSMPKMAQSGIIQLVTKGGRTATVVISTQKPVVTNFGSGSVSNSQTVTVEGTDLDLVDSIVFTGSTSPVTVENATITQCDVTVPDNAVTGPIALIMTNGETVVTNVNVTVNG